MTRQDAFQFPSSRRVHLFSLVSFSSQPWLSCNTELPVPPGQSQAKCCHSRLQHTAAMLMVREHQGAHVDSWQCVWLAALSLWLLCVMSITTVTRCWQATQKRVQWPCICPPSPPPTLGSPPVKTGQRMCHWNTQICSGWWQTAAVEPVAACISFNILANVQREARASRKPLDSSQATQPTTTAVLCNVLITAVGSV